MVPMGLPCKIAYSPRKLLLQWCWSYRVRSDCLKGLAFPALADCMRLTSSRCPVPSWPSETRIHSPMESGGGGHIWRQFGRLSSDLSLDFHLNVELRHWGLRLPPPVRSEDLNELNDVPRATSSSPPVRCPTMIILLLLWNLPLEMCFAHIELERPSLARNWILLCDFWF